MIIWKPDELKQYHFDRATLVLIIFFGVVRSRFKIPYEAYYQAVIIVLAFIILVFGIKNWRKIPKTDWRWAAIGLFACLLVIPIVLIEALQPDQYLDMQIAPGGFGLAIARSLLYQLSFVALFEETLFRGILWRHLQIFGWNENKIFWVQAIYFWLTHLWRIGTPLTFFVTIPITTLTFSLLAKRSGQLLPSIIFHSFSNAFGTLLVYYLVK